MPWRHLACPVGARCRPGGARPARQEKQVGGRQSVFAGAAGEQAGFLALRAGTRELGFLVIDFAHGVVAHRVVAAARAHKGVVATAVRALAAAGAEGVLLDPWNIGGAVEGNPEQRGIHLAPALGRRRNQPSPGTRQGNEGHVRVEPRVQGAGVGRCNCAWRSVSGTIALAVLTRFGRPSLPRGRCTADPPPRFLRGQTRASPSSCHQKHMRHYLHSLFPAAACSR